MKNSLIHSTLKYSVAIPALKSSRVKSNSDVPGSDPDGPTEEILLPYPGAPLLCLALVHLANTDALKVHYKVAAWQP